MISKEKNFISAVIYLHNNSREVLKFFSDLTIMYDKYFENYELIVVNNACTDDTMKKLREFAKKLSKPLTIIHMSMFQSLETCMNAGLDAAIGDFIYEFDSVSIKCDKELVFKAYQTALEGNDIVSVLPSKTNILSKVFYKIFNKNSNSSYPIHTNAFRLVSRRAVNRVHASSAYLPYRKAAYASCGLKTAHLYYNGKIKEIKGGRISLAIDSLALYTNAAFKISAGLAISMMFFAIIEMIYSIIIFLTSKPIEGWTTTMLVLTLGFAGMFAILTIIIKYLSLIIEITFKKQKYLIESIEKIQK